MSPKFSVVIPTHNNTGGLVRCVQQVVENAEVNKEQTEILIVSNGPEETRKAVHPVFANVQLPPHATIRLYHSNQMGFAPACNMGMKYAKGDYIVLLNDDTVPYRTAFAEMCGAMASAEVTDPTVKVGLAGPMLNRVKGAQALDERLMPSMHNPQKIIETALRLAQYVDQKPKECGDQGSLYRPTVNSGGTPFAVTGDISGVCLMITRDCYKAVGDLAVFGLGGWEDNDYCLRAIQAGYLGVLALRAFVYHDMNVTYSRIDPENKMATSTLPQFVEKWHKPKEQSLCVSYYVKIDTKEDADKFLHSFTRMLELTKTFVVFDDRGAIRADTILEPYNLEGQVKIKFCRKDDGVQEEPADRNTLLTMARATGADWIWNLDHDEYPDDRLTPELLQRLLNPVNPQIMCYIIPLSTYWRGREKIRVDNIWGNIKNRSLFRNLPAFGSILPYGNSPFHCERAPAFLPGNLKSPTYAFTVEHTGYDDYEGVKRKQKFYQEKDTVKDEALIGSKNYEHLTDEGDLCLLPFSTPTTTLLMMAHNERFDVLKSLYLHSQLFTETVVVDNGSVDGTAEVCKKLGVRTVLNLCCDDATDPDHMICHFAEARNFAIEQCTTDYIMFLDPDEELSPAHMSLIDKELLQGEDGYLCDIHNYNKDSEGKSTILLSQLPRLFKNRPEIRYNDRVHEVTEKAFFEHNLRCVPSRILINHYGFLKTNKAQRAKKNAQYGAKLYQMLEEDPGNYRALHHLAIHLRDTGDKNTAIELLNRSIEAHPNFFLNRWDLALMFVDQIWHVLATLPKAAIPTNPNDARWQAAQTLMKHLSQYISK